MAMRRSSLNSWMVRQPTKWAVASHFQISSRPSIIFGKKTIVPAHQTTLKEQREGKMTDCVFCKIVSGEIPSSKVYEDEKIIAFMDAGQVNPGHVIVAVKTHVQNIYDLHLVTS
jgi:hypothetical protein